MNSIEILYFWHLKLEINYRRLKKKIIIIIIMIIIIIVIIIGLPTSEDVCFHAGLVLLAFYLHMALYRI